MWNLFEASNLSNSTENGVVDFTRDVTSTSCRFLCSLATCCHSQNMPPHKTFQNALNSSFQYFINLNPQSLEFISLFVDDKLRKGLERVSEEDLEIVLDEVMKLLLYLQEDLQHLAKRLQSLKTVSDNAERSLIVKLKTECGYQFTSKLEGMFTDMKTSQDTMQGFYASMGAEIGDYLTPAVQVHTAGSLPTPSSATCNLPSES
ncbi:hypothetical protein HYC85_012586 [Camellia sinensis]|uniref:Cullin family profile domain-containing protein n=1 Tax=Camellia sinensis TaxID=4442 RepID=A0A7J7HCC8_CAMSI|nr:hypothetical protein HYC85_012586 [Camellia sinensis]